MNTKLIYRKLTEGMKLSLTEYPVKTITGPRLNGKTALCKELFPEYHYINTQKEVDILHTKADKFNAFEIKSSKTFHADFTEGINYLKAIFKDRVQKSAVIYDGSTQFNSLNFRDFYLD